LLDEKVTGQKNPCPFKGAEAKHTYWINTTIFQMSSIMAGLLACTLNYLRFPAKVVAKEVELGEGEDISTPPPLHTTFPNRRKDRQTDRQTALSLVSKGGAGIGSFDPVPDGAGRACVCVCVCVESPPFFFSTFSLL
jgi:hypothetical protein